MSSRKPNWRLWGNKQLARLWECIALSLDVEPDDVTYDRLLDEFDTGSDESNEEFSTRLRLAKDGIRSRTLLIARDVTVDRLPLAEVGIWRFAQWTQTIKPPLEIPAKLRAIKRPRARKSKQGQPGTAFKAEASDAARTTKLEAKEHAMNWKMKIQTEAARRWKSLSHSGAAPSKNNLAPDLAEWCRTNDVRTSEGRFPSGEYIRKHVLTSWNPPRSS